MVILALEQSRKCDTKYACDSCTGYKTRGIVLYYTKPEGTPNPHPILEIRDDWCCNDHQRYKEVEFQDTEEHEDGSVQN